MNYATLRLSDKDNHNDYFDLKFKLLENKFVPKWVDRVLEAQQMQYPISEPWALYNINDNMNPGFLKERLNTLMRRVDRISPMFGFQIDDINDQDSLNKIHAIFEKHHGQIDEWKGSKHFKGMNNSFRKNLSEINQFIHACEMVSGSPKIRVVWFDLPKANTFNNDDYKLFTNKMTFGSLYHLYSDVGKNIESLAEDNDDHHHGVVPNLHYSADFVVHFADRTDQQVEKIENRQKDYVLRNSKYLQSHGYPTGDPKLTTGKIELARLETHWNKTELLSELKNYNNIQSFFLS